MDHYQDGPLSRVPIALSSCLQAVEIAWTLHRVFSVQFAMRCDSAASSPAAVPRKLSALRCSAPQTDTDCYQTDDDNDDDATPVALAPPLLPSFTGEC
ncbi:unnamed protein product [Caenorhabditis auriculariae]|uniref:Uncharacterized protein n=1 Tax=Caenorhabditis auriculariae TaxID=2777116 RepID=A0A8S1GYA0_9PELO|nr:unnamed protein product [Caenorhabditis auriculariae]